MPATPADPANGLVIQEVGAWTPEKHDYLRRYVSATSAARRLFLPPAPGGAAFVDLFAGPGRARVRETGEVINGSPLIAAQHKEAPFTDILLCELDPTAADALRQRLAGDARVGVFEGDCNEQIEKIAAAVPQHGLNMALVDPFGATPLHFDTLAKLARIERMDIILHFPTGDLKRNLEQRERIDCLLGTDRWQERVREPKDVPRLLDVLREQLVPFGYGDSEVKYVPRIKTGKNVPLYHLVFLAKHPLGEKIWRSVVRVEGSGQKRLFP
jgi:three-Cys-motif partner protein